MVEKNLILVVTLLSLPVFQSSSLAAGGLIGSAAPHFRVQSGDDKELTLDMIKGKEDMAIYCDWEGKLSSDYRLKADVSNIVIIDKGASIRFFTSGEVTAEEINDVKLLLKVLAGE